MTQLLVSSSFIILGAMLVAGLIKWAATNLFWAIALFLLGCVAAVIIGAVKMVWDFRRD